MTCLPEVGDDGEAHRGIDGGSDDIPRAEVLMDTPGNCNFGRGPLVSSCMKINLNTSPTSYEAAPLVIEKSTLTWIKTATVGTVDSGQISLSPLAIVLVLVRNHGD
jgi:hypothetical protein